MGQVVEIDELMALIGPLRTEGKQISFANGHFDLLHVGHLRYLTGAKAEGDVLVVGVNGDASVAHHKGAGRPINPAEERAELIAALAPVDFVILFEEWGPDSLLRTLEPEIHCKGTDYGSPEAVPEYQTVCAYGGRTVLVGDPKDHSTRDLIAKARELD